MIHLLYRALSIQSTSIATTEPHKEKNVAQPRHLSFALVPPVPRVVVLLEDDDDEEDIFQY